MPTTRMLSRISVPRATSGDQWKKKITNASMQKAMTEASSRAVKSANVT